MIKAGVAVRRRRTALAFPGVQTDVMVITSGGEEGGLVSVSLGELEAEHVAVKAERAVEISHFQVHVADADRVMNADTHASTVTRSSRETAFRFGPNSCVSPGSSNTSSFPAS